MKPVADSLPSTLPVDLADVSSRSDGSTSREPYWSAFRLRLTVRDGSDSRDVVVPRPLALLGSHEGCDLVLDDPAIPKRCYCLVLTSGGLFGSSLLAGQAKSRSPAFRRVSVRRTIRLGRYTLRVEILDDGGQPLRVEKLSSMCDQDLGAIRWSQYGVAHAVELRAEQPLLIGRHAPCHVRPDDSTLSSVHCLVYPQSTQLWVVDLCSSNGTWVRRTRVPHAVIEPGRSWKIGRTRLRWCATQPSGEPNCESAEETIYTLNSQIQDLQIEIQELRTTRDRLQQRDAALQEQWEALQRDQADWIAWQELEVTRLSDSNTELQQARIELAQEQAAWQSEREKASHAWEEFTRQQSEELETRRRELEDQINDWGVERDEQIARINQRDEDVAATQQSLLAQQREIETQLAHFSQQQQQLAIEQQQLSAERAALREKQDTWVRLRQQSQRDQQHQAAVQNHLRDQLKQAKVMLAQMQREREQSLGQRLRTQWSLKSREEAVGTREQQLEEQTAQLAAWESQLRRQQQELIDQRRRDLSLSDHPPSPDGVPQNGEVDGAWTEVTSTANTYLAAADFTELLNEVLQDSDADEKEDNVDGLG